MTNRVDIAKRLYGVRSQNGNAYGAQSGAASVMYGTATADAVGSAGAYRVTVQLDTSPEGTTAQFACDSKISQGDRVAVIWQGGTYRAVSIAQTSRDAEEALSKYDQINAAIGGIQEEIDNVSDQVDGVRQDAQQAAQSAQEAAEDAEKAAAAADELQGQIKDVTVTVDGVVKDVDELSTSVTGAVSTANQALTAASTAQQDINGFKTQVSQTYETKKDADDAIAKEVLDRNSAISQSASSILAQVSQNYVNNETGAKLATKSEVEQTANSLKAELTSAFEDELSGYATNASVTATADSIRSEVNSNYLSKNDASKTYAAQSSLTQIATEIRSEVDEVVSDGDKKYATKTELSQTSNSLTININQAATAASNAQKTADSASSAASSAQTTANTANSNASKAQTTANSANTAASNAQTTANTANSNASKAQTAANNAQTTATNAQNGVNTINTYFLFDTDGLHVGKRASSAAGAAYQTAESVVGADGSFSIYDGDTKLATIKPGEVSLGMDGATSQIKMCNSEFRLTSTGSANTLESNHSMTLRGIGESARFYVSNANAVNAFWANTSATEGMLVGACVIYSGATRTGGTLRSTYGTYAIIDIFFNDGSRGYCARFNPLLNAATNISRTILSGTTMYVGSAIVTFSGSNFTVSQNIQFQCQSGSAPVLESRTEGPLQITRIIGWM